MRGGNWERRKCHSLITAKILLLQIDNLDGITMPNQLYFDFISRNRLKHTWATLVFNTKKNYAVALDS